MRGLLIAAPASGQGKTTLTLGLLRALARRGEAVASAKSGPDYIDPAFHAAATGHPCVTLDAWAATPAQLRARAAMQPAELLIVEGAMGLYDGAVTHRLAAVDGTGGGDEGGGDAARRRRDRARASAASTTATRRHPARERDATEAEPANPLWPSRGHAAWTPTRPSSEAAPGQHQALLTSGDPGARRPRPPRRSRRHGAPAGSRRSRPRPARDREVPRSPPPRSRRRRPLRRPAATPAPQPGSAAALAAALGIPVLLVLDVSRMGQGAAAIVHGLATFPGAPPIAGVVLNRAGSARHAAMVAQAIQPIAPVLGVLPRRDDLALPSRHLGLVQAGETADLPAFLDRAADAVAAGCDLEALRAAAAPLAVAEPQPARLPPLGQRIAVARDAAFSFAYWHMLEDWRARGAELAPFSPLADEPPDPAADAVFLPGGYPELHPGRIAAAQRFRAGMLAAAARGAAIYGECGGFMVLGDGITDGEGRRHAMLGLLRLETGVERPRRTLGYRRLAPLAGPWPGPLAAHEFHTARVLRQEGAPLFAMRDAAGTDLGPTGLVSGRVAGSWAHVIEPAG